MLTRARIPLRYLAGAVWLDVLGAAAIGSGVALVTFQFGDHIPELPVAVPAILGTAISIILSFMVNQSYDRWWEARKVWGAIVNDSRSLARQALTFSNEHPVAQRLVRRQIAWCHALGQSLRGLDWSVGAAPHLGADDVERVGRYLNKPLALASLQSHDARTLAAEGVISDYQRVAIDDSLTRLIDSQGRAERIKNTVFPRTYRVALHGAIYLFLTLFSFSMAQLHKWWEIPLAIAISIPFFLLERTATFMQDPFENRPTDTPMSAIARNIEINLLQMLGDEDVPEPAQPSEFFLL